jgi:hypothetical protein
MPPSAGGWAGERTSASLSAWRAVNAASLHSSSSSSEAVQSESGGMAASAARTRGVEISGRGETMPCAELPGGCLASLTALQPADTEPRLMGRVCAAARTLAVSCCRVLGPTEKT